MYSLANDQWDSNFPEMSESRVRSSCVVAGNDTLYAIGGVGLKNIEKIYIGRYDGNGNDLSV